MMFIKDASPIDKDQLRPSLRSRVSALGAALKPRRHVQYPSAMMPSASQSECSTLVDFAIEDVYLNDDVQELETEDCMLDAENSAWVNGKHSVSPRAKRHNCRRASHRVLVALPETELLAAENSAWVPKGGVAQTTQKAHTRFFSSSRHAQEPSGVEPEYLDPEDRAWM